jgi:hypothetical protein
VLISHLEILKIIKFKEVGITNLWRVKNNLNLKSWIMILKKKLNLWTPNQSILDHNRS